MRQLIQFLTNRRYFFLFLILEAVAFGITLSHFRYHNSLFVNSMGDMVGSVYDSFNYSERYFNLREKNEQLALENAELRNKLALRAEEISAWASSDSLQAQYDYTDAKILSNSFKKRSNYLIINKGKLHGVKEDMGVITDRGVIGIVTHASKHYAIAMSVLHQKTNISAHIKGSRFFGPVSWDGRDPGLLQLSDIPRQAVLQNGLEIVCDSKSSIFPEGTPIGKIESFQLSENKSYYNIQVRVHEDFTNLDHVYLIKNIFQEEYRTLKEMEGDE